MAVDGMDDRREPDGGRHSRKKDQEKKTNWGTEYVR